MQAVLHSFGYSLDYLREQVSSLSSDQMVAQVGLIRNHPTWVIGHLTVTCQELGGALGMSPWLAKDWHELFGTGSRPVGSTEVYPSKRELLAALADAQKRIGDAVQELSHSQLDKFFPDPAYREVFPSIRHALTQVLTAHTGYHLGQLSLWRKLAGLPNMRRVYE